MYIHLLDNPSVCTICRDAATGVGAGVNPRVITRFKDEDEDLKLLVLLVLQMLCLLQLFVVDLFVELPLCLSQ